MTKFTQFEDAQLPLVPVELSPNTVERMNRACVAVCATASCVGMTCRHCLFQVDATGQSVRSKRFERWEEFEHYRALKEQEAKELLTQQGVQINEQTR